MKKATSTRDQHPDETKSCKSFPKTIRVLKRDDFAAVHQASVFAADQILVVTARNNGLGVTRLGLNVGKKVGNAVVRNRWKRLIREAFRVSKNELPQGLDLVVRPRKGAAGNYVAVAKSLSILARRVAKKCNRNGTPTR